MELCRPSIHTNINGAHTHTRIYAHIFGITSSPVTGLLGCQALSYDRLTAEPLFQTHPPSRHNTPSSISSHLPPSSAPQWAFMDHFHHTKPTFVHHQPLSPRSPHTFSFSFFFFFFFMCGCFHWNQLSSGKPNNASCERGHGSLRCFVYYVIPPVSWGK